MEDGKKTLLDALNASAEDLANGIDTHRCLLASLVGGDAGRCEMKPLFTHCPLRSREQTLREAIKEAIDVLEESRKAFKSKRLEALRKKLTDVLIDTD